MQILIPGALPPYPVATELISHVEKACPALIQRLNTLPAIRLDMSLEQLGCTPYEALLLQHQGYQTEAGLLLGAGLAPYRANVTQAGETVWLAELSSIEIGSTGAQLAHPDSLHITTEESDALFDAVSDLWVDSGISILPINPTCWRVWLNAPAELTTISPHALHGMALTDWLPKHESLRTWRRLLSEIQTVWHDHPVNQARIARALPPINTLWLFGGGHGWKASVQAEKFEVFDKLAMSHAAEDWSSWIQALPELSARLDQIPAEATITLLGKQHAVEIKPAVFAWWRSLLPKRQQNWKSWWNLPS